MEKIFLYKILIGSLFMVPADSKEEADEIMKEFFALNYKKGVRAYFEKEIELKKRGTVIQIG